MRYSNKECELLSLTWIGSEDDDPPWTGNKVLWRGQIVPFLHSVSWRSSGAGEPDEVIIHVTPKRDRGYKSDEDCSAIYDDMKAHGVRIFDYPNQGDRY